MSPPHTVLIVEDDPTSLEATAAYFEVEGYQVFRAHGSGEMDRILSLHAVDLLILDLRLPGKDGLTLLRELRARSALPVIVVSSRTDDIDHIVALELGADDFLDKPVNLRELLVRARNILQRATASPNSKQENASILRFAGWTLDTSSRRLTDPQGANVHLTRGEYELLHGLTRRPRQVMQRDQLLDCIGSRERDPFDRSVDVLIGRLRAKIERDARHPELIVTVHGVGYVFLGVIEAAPPLRAKTE